MKKQSVMQEKCMTYLHVSEHAIDRLRENHAEWTLRSMTSPQGDSTAGHLLSTGKQVLYASNHFLK